MKIIEINGIKLEIDERTARTVESYKVGDTIKVLIKNYGDNYTVHPGVIVGFADFANLPTIEVMYVTADRWDTDAFKFVSINAASKDIEITPHNELEAILDKAPIIEKFDRAIRKMESDLEDMQMKREYFINRFAKAFEPSDKEQAA